ncbi:hypothetical protein [Spongiactinospora sp. TRM90649]|uniref:hypothetical protein n=1 Tax=Spongiactinospora sp. TRM90649 TaxID=3031114 RepID=UPI0023F86774|nr:hypothetical protein [Spongiactinospora sp. TRM90649]MDF5756599.1 hypothetical protein [Spongiactinospora sp. TRM90649]
MAITTLREAEAVNRLIGYLIGRPVGWMPVPTFEEARQALVLLADAAHRKYGGSGFSGSAAQELWAEAAQPATGEGEEQ